MGVVRSRRKRIPEGRSVVLLRWVRAEETTKRRSAEGRRRRKTTAEAVVEVEVEVAHAFIVVCASQVDTEPWQL
jgi:hypothetical protein